MQANVAQFGTAPELTGVLQFTHLQLFPEVMHGIANRHTEHQQTYSAVAEQVHGNRVAWVTEPSAEPIPGTDGLITQQPNVRLRIGTSDCVPIILYNPILRAGGVIHAGRRGTEANILSMALAKLGAADTYVGIGPAIGPCCYDEINLQDINYQQALDAGTLPEHIEIIQVCTRCYQETYFSYRGGDRTNFGTYFELRSL